MTRREQKALEQALADFEALGGSCLYDGEIRMLGLDGTAVTDADLARLIHLPGLQALNLRDTNVTDAALDHVRAVPTLELLIVIGTKVTPAAVKRLKTDIPALKVQTKPRKGPAINPFTGEPIGESIRRVVADSAPSDPPPVGQPRRARRAPRG